VSVAIVSGLYLALLLWAAASDLARYRVPNAAVVALVVLFAGSFLLLGASSQWGQHLIAALLALGLGGGFYALGQMGAGDVKLIAAVSLWAGLAGLLPLLVLVAVSGLGLMLVILALRQMPMIAARLGRTISVEGLPRVMRRGEGIPYAVAIAAGAAAALPWYGPWLWH